MVDEFGGKFDGEIQLGNGTQFRIGFFFTDNRHFVVAIYGESSWRFPAGSQTTWQEVSKVLRLQEEDAQNMTDFINTQLDGLDELDHVGEYQKAFCA